MSQLVISNDTQKILDEGQKLIDRISSFETASQQSYLVPPIKLIEDLIDDMRNFIAKMNVVDEPKSKEEFFVCELKRILENHIIFLTLDHLVSSAPSFEEILNVYGITQDDLDATDQWLEANLSKVKQVNEELILKINPDDKKIHSDMGLREIRKAAESMVNSHIEIINKALIDNLGDNEAVMNFFKQYKIMANTQTGRAYINDDAKIVSIGVERVTYVINGHVKILPYELLRVYAHEVFGHGLNFATSHCSTELPKFLRTLAGEFNTASLEAVSQYFEKEFFHTLHQNPKISESLNFDEPFEKIYEEFTQRQLLGDYMSKFNAYALKELAKSGEPKSQDEFTNLIKKLSKFSISPSWPFNIINGSRDSWDQKTGRMLWKTASEIQYHSRVLDRALNGLSPEKLAEAKKVILKGYFTPKGLEDWVRINLKSD